MSDTVTIKLTPKQAAALLPLLAEIEAAYLAGKPTMIVGQVDSQLRTARFAVLTHKQTAGVLKVVRPHAELKPEV